jgi:hypothetical protein
MSYAGISWLKLNLCRALLLVALPTACAVGVEPTSEGDGTDPDGTAGTSPATGGTPGTSGSGSVLPKAGTTGTGGSVVANPFGGSASAGTSTGGSSTAGTSAGGAGGASSAGSSSGGSAGAAGKGSGGSAGAGGSGTGGCACPVKKVWMDNTNLSLVTNDCVDVAGALYLYTGAKPQTWANKDCNPTMQLAWCSDMGADYKFMLCK